MLLRFGYRTEVDGDGFEAGIKVTSFKPGLIVLDLMMPGIDGFEVCRRIKGDRSTANVKVLAVTGYDTPENRERIIAAGADAYMTKPLDGEAFLDKVRALLKNGNGIRRMK
jgi:DNA-binding response OmpR family regulator